MGRKCITGIEASLGNSAKLEGWSGIVVDASSRKTAPCGGRQVFTRVTVGVESKKVSAKSVYGLGKSYDLLSLHLADTPDATMNEMVGRCAAWQVDTIRLEFLSKVHVLKRGALSKAVNSGIYFEVSLQEGLGAKTRAERISWLANVKELLRITKKSHVIFSLEAKDEAGLLPPDTVIQVIEKFGVRRSVAERMISTNVTDMIKRAALRRHSLNGIVLVEDGESDFKKMCYL